MTSSEFFEKMPLRSVYLYRPPKAGAVTRSFLRAAGIEQVFYYAYARHAIRVGLVSVGVGTGDQVLVPSFICRDVLAAISSLGAKPVFYAVTEALSPSLPPDRWPQAKSVLAVNYFGFPQDLAPFREYAQRTGAVVVEDNAHGLFSRDEQGSFLGTRGDLGVFSFRKTIPLINGAGLVINARQKIVSTPQQMSWVGMSRGERARQEAKSCLARLIPWISDRPISWSIKAIGLLRSARSARSVRQPDWEAEMPTPSATSEGIVACLKNFPWELEVERRRHLYMRLSDEMRQPDVRPVFSTLLAGVAPYAFCFYLSPASHDVVAKKIQGLGLRLINWPDLPVSVRQDCPDFYRNVWAIPFMW